ncbi:hypothetical protein [Streptomyces sp. NPDC090021]|uniref:hypothetical protein n=1 Tax=Streptomyces sp. NPDC090021 TaxID=3365919 RepID=UPI003807929E
MSTDSVCAGWASYAARRASASPRAPSSATALRERRNADLGLFERRIRADIATGALPADTEARAPAWYAGAVLQGMFRQSRDGATREELEAVAERALSAWP